MADFFQANRYIRVTIHGDERAFTPLLDVSSFLYDFNLLYEISRLAIDPAYESFRFTPNAVYRKGRPLEDSDRLHVERIGVSSPLELTTIIVAAPVAATTLWVTLQSANMISNWSLNRRKLKAEVEKLELENSERRALPPPREQPDVRETDWSPSRDTPVADLIEHPELVERLLERREASGIYRNVTKRLRQSTIRVTKVEVEMIERLPGGDEDR